MKAYFTSLFLLIIGSAIGQTTNVKVGVWSDNTVWIAGLVPVDTSNIVLSYDITVDINAICKSLNTNGHSVTVNTGVTLNVVGDSAFTDSRDGQTYPFKHIGTQVWMTKNLNYATPGSWCSIEDLGGCAVYGRLYTWDEALIVAPAGWHLPSDKEWTVLTDYLGDTAVAGGKMKEAGTSHWLSPNTGADNSSGFTGFPGGYRLYIWFSTVGEVGLWWSSTESEIDSVLARCRGLYSSGSNVDTRHEEKGWGLSVRCVRD